jgi:hypothetical protein
LSVMTHSSLISFLSRFVSLSIFKDNKNTSIGQFNVRITQIAN